MPHANGDQSSESETETWLDRRLDKADEEILKWILVGVVGSSGVLLGDVLSAKVLGVSTAALFSLWMISFLRVRLLKKRIAALKLAHVSHEQSPSPLVPAFLSQSDQMSDHSFSILCMIFDAHNRKEKLRREDFQKRLPLLDTDLDSAIPPLFEGGYVYQDDDDRLDVDPEEFHLLPKGASYVTSRRKDN